MTAIRRVAVIVNPIAGSGRRVRAGRRRAERAKGCLEAAGVRANIFVSERPHHAGELTRTALEQRPDLVFAWGGDGTVNEVASILAFSETPLAIVPDGSGNGLAASLGVPRPPEAAIRSALGRSERVIDVGQLDDRLFFNVAGIGFDAHVARLFAETPGRRGFATYLRIALRELPRFTPTRCRVVLHGESREHRVDLVALANGAEYGNGARIAPNARLDDGELDLVVVESRSPVVNLWRAGRLMAGGLQNGSGVEITRVRMLRIEADAPIPYHVDGEPGIAGAAIDIRVHAGALRVRS